MRKFTVKATYDGHWEPSGYDVIDPFGFVFEFCDEKHIAEGLAEAYTKAYALGWNDAVEQGADTLIPGSDDMMSGYETATSYK